LFDFQSELKQAEEGRDSGVKVTEHRFDEKFPLHVLFYGRSNHRLDSYSVLKSDTQVFFNLKKITGHGLFL